MNDLAASMLGLVGRIPYSLGASPDAVGWAAANAKGDCSSVVVWAGRQHGVTWPRTADEQFRATEATRVARPSRSTLQRNDLLFFGGWNDPSNPPGYAGVQHVAVSLGGDDLVQEGGGNAQHASIPNVNVGTVSAYGAHFLYATRPLGGSMIPIRLVSAGGGVIATNGNPLSRLVDVGTGEYVPLTATSYQVFGAVDLGGVLYGSVARGAAYLVSQGGRPMVLFTTDVASIAPAAGAHTAQLLIDGQPAGAVLTF